MEKIEEMKSKNFINFRPKKYNNITCTVDGINFDSRREADYYGQLKYEKRAGLIKNFERQVEFELLAYQPFGNGFHHKVCIHRVDFLVTLLNGSTEIREVKGAVNALWDLKRKIFECNYPDIPYKVVK